MNCENCSNPFNLTNRQPLTLPCCNESICKQCKEEIGGAPQNEFTCPLQQCKILSKNSNFWPTKAIEKFLRSQIGIYCDEHPKDQAEIYCIDLKKLMCTSCVINLHKTPNSVRTDKEAINSYLNNLQEKLRIEFELIRTQIHLIDEFQQNKMQLSASKFMAIINKAQEILLPRIQDKFEKAKLKFMVGHKYQHSAIMSQDDVLFLKDALNKQELQLNLIYRGSRDGFEVSNFHKQCDGKGPTICVIKTEHNYEFGGFTSLSYSSPEKEEPKSDSSAFVFSLTKREKFIQYKNQQYALIMNKNYGPAFGHYADFLIYKQCNQQRSSYAKLGGTYSLPYGVQDESEQSESYLAGSNNFLVSEIEVFQVL